jgi:hypothetical protein
LALLSYSPLFFAFFCTAKKEMQKRKCKKESESPLLGLEPCPHLLFRVRFGGSGLRQRKNGKKCREEKHQKRRSNSKHMYQTCSSLFSHQTIKDFGIFFLYVFFSPGWRQENIKNIFPKNKQTAFVFYRFLFFFSFSKKKRATKMEKSEEGEAAKIAPSACFHPPLDLDLALFQPCLATSVFFAFFLLFFAAQKMQKKSKQGSGDEEGFAPQLCRP